MMQELNVLALVKGHERYVFVYDDASHLALIEALQAWAMRPDLSFSWFDAAVLADRSQQQLQAAGSSQMEAAVRRQRASLAEGE
jgi:hypothetical protein